MLDFRFFLTTYAALGVSPAFAAGSKNAALAGTPTFPGWVRIWFRLSATIKMQERRKGTGHGSR